MSSQTPPTPPELFATAGSIVHALAVRLIDLSEAIRQGQRTVELARHVERLIGLTQTSIKEITPAVRQLGKVRR